MSRVARQGMGQRDTPVFCRAGSATRSDERGSLRMSNGRPPSTDVGTVLLHWLIVALLIVLVATGLRIASADAGLGWLGLLDPILPVEHLWYRHLIAAAALAAGLVAYAAYIVRARLTQRTRLDWARVTLLLRSGRPRWASANVLTVWAMLVALGVELVTGLALFLGYGGLWLTLHLHATWVLLVLAAAHVLVHLQYGGMRQLLRIFKPARLVMAPPPPDLAELLAEQLELRERETQRTSEKPAAAPAAAPAGLAAAPPADSRQSAKPLTKPVKKPARKPSRKRDRPRRAWPLARAVAAGSIMLGAAIAVEPLTRTSLRIPKVERMAAPRLDGDLSDPVWSHAPVASVVTQHGSGFAGTGESLVEIRAVHDGEYAYFAFVWTDPTRSLKHLPLVKRHDGWYVAQSGHDIGDENELHEDKLAVLFARSTLHLIGAAIHLARAPLADKPPSLAGRGLHYTLDGSVADVWQWRASHGGPTGHIDNCHFGGPAEPTRDQADGRARYAGGFARDPGSPAYRDNFNPEPPGGYMTPIQPHRLPTQPAAMTAAMGRIQNDVDQSESEGARWWMTEEESAPYSKSADDAIKVGTVIPGVIVRSAAEEGATAVRGVARWAAGRWVLEVARRLNTGSAWDLPIASGLLMWVATFDHSETRHTWHIRPIRLEVE
jgi:cytochrome b subunit of formate dehydrogenase